MRARGQIGGQGASLPRARRRAIGSVATFLTAAVLVVGFVLWGMSLSLAFSLITLVLLRLAIHKLPDTDFAATSWLPAAVVALLPLADPPTSSAVTANSAPAISTLKAPTGTPTMLWTA